MTKQEQIALWAYCERTFNQTVLFWFIFLNLNFLFYKLFYPAMQWESRSIVDDKKIILRAA